MVALNAYIPTLARDAQDVVAARAAVVQLQRAAPSDDHTPAEEDGADAPLLASAESDELEDGEHPSPALADAKKAHDAVLSATTARISSQGIALGYSAGILMLVLALVPVSAMHGSTDALRLAVGLSGLWWALFSLPAAAWLPGGASVDISDGVAGDSGAHGAEEWRMSREIAHAWARLGRMLRPSQIARLRHTFLYLAAWFLLSDGFTTITSTALLFAKTSLHMPSSSLILIGVLTPSAGIAGSLLWPAVQRRTGWTNLRVLVTLVGMASAIPAYGCLGFLPVFRSSAVKFGGLTTPGEMYVLAVYFVRPFLGTSTLNVG